MSLNRKKIFCWAGWYRLNADDYKAIFIKKHLEIISEIADVYCFHITHQKNHKWFRKYTLKENFGDVHIHIIPAFFPLKILGYFLIPVIEYFRSKRRLKKIDIFHLHCSYPYAAFTLFLRFFNIKKWILTEHWSGYTFFDNQYARLNILLKYLIKRFLHRCNKLSTPSEFLMNQMIERFSFLSNKIFLTHNLIIIPDVISNTKILNQTLKLLSISNLTDYPKNISFLLEVIKEVSNQIPITLDIYGDGRDKELLIKKAQQLNILNKIVFFKGKVSNDKISEIYHQYHAFILLSRFETFSIVAAEAIAHGLPVIVTKCGGPEEFVNESNGYLVPINDLNATVNAILDLYQKYSKFSPQKVQQTIIHKYNKDTIKQQFEQLCQ
ncbi:MAG: glycosyltransferase family 4 protein [Bacteroidota bacterium]